MRDISVYVAFVIYSLWVLFCKTKRLLCFAYSIMTQWHDMKWKQHESEELFGKGLCCLASLCDDWQHGCVITQNSLLMKVKHSCSFNNYPQQDKSKFVPPLEHGDSVTRLFLTLDITLWHAEWNNGSPWVMADGKNQGKKQDRLNASHFAKCSSGHHITRKWTDRLRKRTEEHQWSIVCSEGAPSNSSGSQYIKETKIHYTICTEIFYKHKLRHL